MKQFCNMQCSITFEVLHIKLYALFKGAGAWPVVPHIIEVLDTGVKYLFGPLFCSQLVADLNCANSTPVNFGRGNNTKGLKKKKYAAIISSVDMDWRMWEIQNMAN